MFFLSEYYKRDWIATATKLGKVDVRLEIGMRPLGLSKKSFVLG